MSACRPSWLACSDVRREAASERNLRTEREGLFSAVVESSNDAIITKLLDGTITGWNGAAERLFGFTAAEAIGKSINIIVPPDRRDEVRNIVERISRGEPIEHYETSRVRKDGRTVDVSLSISPIRSASGKIVGISKTARDITESKRTQHALSQEIEERRRIFDSSNDLILVTDTAGNFIQVSPSVTDDPRLSALRHDRTQRGGIHPPRRSRTHPQGDAGGAAGTEQAQFRDALCQQGGQGGRAELDRDVVGAGPPPLLHRPRPDRKAGRGSPVAACAEDGCGRPAHGRRRARLQQYPDRDHRHHRHSGRSRRRSSPQLAAIAKLIDEAAERGANLTKHLLAFARKQPLQPLEVDVNALVLEAAKLLHPTLGEHIEITPLLAEDAWTALADPNQLTTAVLNLAINARDAMPNGGKLALETSNVFLDENYASMHSEVTPGNYVMIAVSDTGTGIPAALLERVFEPFFTTKEVGRGTGLGLSMVFGFVKQSGGHVKIYSEEGHGTSVKIYLPRATGLHQTAAEALVSVDIEGGNETVLVVEDDALVRRYVMTQIESLGYTTLEAANASDALQHHRRCRHHRPAVHRRDHARPHERPPAGRRSAEAAAGPQDAVSRRDIPRTPSSITAGWIPACCCWRNPTANPSSPG